MSGYKEKDKSTADLFYIKRKDEKPVWDENEKEYLHIVYHYIQYYYKRAENYKVWYRCLSVLKIIILAFIPVSQACDYLVGFPWVIALASSMCILLESVMALFNMKEKWVHYRKVGNALMCEERKYVTGTGVYQQEDDKKAFTRFVENTEVIISNESDDWNQMVQSGKQNSKNYNARRGES